MSKKYKFNSDVVVTFADGKMKLEANGHRVVGAIGLNGNEGCLKKYHLTPVS